MIYRGRPCLTFFSSVVKNVANANIEIKKLVYIYLVHYAESEPDLALLSINTIQKSLSDQNPKVRAMALRTMSGIKVPVISQIVSLAIKKGCADLVPIVRKAAALAIPKCYRLDPNTLPQLVEYISALLGDRQYFVAGAAVVAMLEICPTRVDLLHKHYRALVKKMVDMDEWSQLATLQLLTQYSRRCFPLQFREARQEQAKGFYDQDVESSDKGISRSTTRILDPDLDLFLRTCKSLLYSRNSAVIVSIARCFSDLGTHDHVRTVAGPLISLLRSIPEVQGIAMRNILGLCRQHPTLFAEYATHFLVHAKDSPVLSQLKLDIIPLVFPHCEPHVKGILISELSHLSHSSSQYLVQEAVRAIGRCAQSDPSAADRCMTILLSRASSQEEGLAAEALSVLRYLIQQKPAAHTHTIIRLAKNLDTASDPRARATVIWLVGEYASATESSGIAPDVLRLLVKGFPGESEPAKMQIIVLAAKVYLRHLIEVQPGPVSDSKADEEKPTGNIQHQEGLRYMQKLWEHLLLLVRYDTSFDLRDRMRTYRSLLAIPQSTQLASLLLLAEKPLPVAVTSSEVIEHQPIGSASLVLGSQTRLPQSMFLPDWVNEGEEPDPKLRDSEYSVVVPEARVLSANAQLARSTAAGVNKPAGKDSGPKAKTLDDWLAEGNNSSEEEETDEASGSEETDEDEESDDAQDMSEQARLAS